MKLILLISFFCSVLAMAQPSTRVIKELKKIESFREASKAMEDKLPELAIPQLRKTLLNKKLSAPAKVTTTLTLAEALIQAGLLHPGEDKFAEEAIHLLSQKKIQSEPSAPLLLAQALTSLGQYTKAEKKLAGIPPKHPHFKEVQLIRARLLSMLSRQKEELALLTHLIKSSPKKTTKTVNIARILATEAFISQSDFSAAEKMLSKIDCQYPLINQLAHYLKAQISLLQKDTSNAISQFQSLTSESNHLNNHLFNSSILGLADAFVIKQKKEEALTLLSNFISNHQDSPILQDAFLRLARLLPPDLPSDDPSMIKIQSWIPSLTPTNNALLLDHYRASTPPPYPATDNKHIDLTALALHLQAQLLIKSNNPKKYPLALALLNRLRTLHTNSSDPASELYFELFTGSLLNTAEIHLKQNNPTQAIFTLQVMEKTAFSPYLKEKANFILGKLLTKEKKYAQASEAFKRARNSSIPQLSNAAKINAAITSLFSGKLNEFETILTKTSSPKLQSSLRLELALWKCKHFKKSGRDDLLKFINQFPNHTRINEARLALAEACINIYPPNIPLAKKQLSIITPLFKDADHQFTITQINYRAAELLGNWPEVIEITSSFIKRFPKDSRVPNLLLKQGESYYHNEDFNEARKIFQQINTQFPQSPYVAYAKFYTAMAARLEGTEQARKESVKTFSEIIKSTSPLALEARIQLSRVLIDLHRYSEAESTLTPLLSSKKVNDSILKDASILMADCLHRQGANHPKKYKEALKIYDTLLKNKKLPLAWINRIYFLRGQTLESMNLLDKALESYYKVIAKTPTSSKNKKTQIEWFWFYRCGFKALSLLENNKRWEAAVHLARRIASFNGPRAEEASQRANTLAKRHMIWEDTTPHPKAIKASNN